MLFSQLRDLQFNMYEDRKFLEYLSSEGLRVPWEVALQFYYDHRQNEDFQLQYGDLDLSLLNWQMEEWTAKQIMEFSVYPRFQRWVNIAAQRSADFARVGFAAMDSRPAVVEHWEKQNTWRVPPIVIDSAIIIPAHVGCHLVEGHTRLGCLIGLARQGVIPVGSVHKIFRGCYP